MLTKVIFYNIILLFLYLHVGLCCDFIVNPIVIVITIVVDTCPLTEFEGGLQFVFEPVIMHTAARRLRSL